MNKDISPSLREADKLINGARQDQYGNPEMSFEMISTMWQIYLDNRPQPQEPLEAKDVAIMMTLMKVCRMCGQKWKRDNVLDAIGYLAILADRLTGEKED